jgi:hypothetical protein
MIAQDSFWQTQVAVFDRHQRSLACIVSIAVLLTLHRSYGVVRMPFDAAEYWHLSSPAAFGTSTLHRGYLFPALLLPLHYLSDLLADPVRVFRAGMSCLYGVTLALLVPAAFQQAFGGKVSFCRRLVPVLLLAALFPGVLVFSLNDLPALLLAVGGLYLALRGMLQGTVTRFLAMLAGSGALLGAAYNTRTIYVFALAGLLAMLAVRGKGLSAACSRWLGIAAVVAGVVAVSVPQLIVNQRVHGSASPAVPARIDKHSLFSSQLVWGMSVQRFETTVSPEAPAPTVFYLDPAGTQLFNAVSGQGDLYSLPYYLQVVAQHPLHFLGLYTHHAINGLDVRDGILYTLEASPLRTGLAWFNFTVLALACWVAWSLRTRSMQPLPPGMWPAAAGWRWSLGVLLLPVVAIVPAAIETRFFLPLHLLAYCVIAFYFDAAALRESFKRHGPAIILAVVGAAGVFFAVTLSTVAQLHYNWPGYYRNVLPPPK